ncbi:MAG: GIY-YIG nuclease family protein [Cyanophyceae cyanobacterium]
MSAEIADGSEAMPSLGELPFLPYIDGEGLLPAVTEGTIGIYAIFDADRALQYVGYSRNTAASLAQHLVRQGDRCHWLKFHPITRPSRSILEAIRDRWIADQDRPPPGNGPDADVWENPINAAIAFNDAERAAIANADTEAARAKAIKQATRRIEAMILEPLTQRGVTIPLRFNPKLKERGLLDL